MRAILVGTVLGGSALGLLLGAVQKLGGDPLAGGGAALAAVAPDGRGAAGADPARVVPAWAIPAPPAAERAPPPQVAAPRPAPEVPAQTARYTKPVVVDAGRVKSGTTTIVLDGIAAPARKESCDNGAGGKWACGQRAAAALSLFLKARAMECTTVPVAGQGPAPSEAKPARAAGKRESKPVATTHAGQCRVGGVDLAQWLVKNGWAKADGPALAKEAAAAKQARLGLWGPGVARLAGR